MTASIIGTALGLMAVLIGAVLGIAGFVFWLWMLIHAITNKGLEDVEKIVWVLVIIFLPVIGSIIYFFIGRPKGRGAIG
jgi:phospholipase D-like protein